MKKDVTELIEYFSKNYSSLVTVVTILRWGWFHIINMKSKTYLILNSCWKIEWYVFSVKYPKNLQTAHCPMVFKWSDF